MIGASASLLMALNGRVAGVSGVAAGLLARLPKIDSWRGLFLAGLVGGGLVARWVLGDVFSTQGTGVVAAVVAGLLVGVGTRLANGCTSGHGVCGVSRFSVRSLVATVTFIAAGALTVGALR